jgi:hypothetical protein
MQLLPLLLRLAILQERAVLLGRILRKRGG